jgi:hypothetical protein
MRRCVIFLFFLSRVATDQIGPRPPHSWNFEITHRRTAVGRIPLDEGQTSMRPPGFEYEIPASERPQTYALLRAATGIGAVH